MKTAARFPLLLRYPGGKHYAINLLHRFWHGVEHTEYREPFAGGATVFFNKEKVGVNWLNDLDTELITTFKIISSSREREVLIKRVSNEDATPDRWKEIFAYKPKTELDIAYKYLYLNRTSFSGKLVSAAWGYRPKRSLPPERWFERIRPCGEKLELVNLTSVDFEEVISAPSRKKVLMYVDPPYYLPPKNKHYRHGLDKEDHLRLCQALKKTKHKFFLTYDNAEQIKNLYSWANIFPVDFFYRVGNSASQQGSRRKGFELIITNFDLDEVLLK